MSTKILINSSINAIALSPDKTKVAVAGREVLSIYKLNDDGDHKVNNLRSGNKLNLNYSSNDVKWSPNFATPQLIASAATNGTIVLWNTLRFKQDRIIMEHQRSVNRVAFHSSDPFLLSASQDGLVKLWDLRIENTCRLEFRGNCESVRDVQFNPLIPYEFVAAYENGSVLKWDMRNQNVCEKKINAHSGICLTVDYHSDGKTLATGGRDKCIKIWDTKSECRKPSNSIQMMASVGKIAWRPFEAYQLAATALLTDYRVHVYDVHQPFIPLYSSDEHTNVTTGIVWKSRDEIISCSKDKTMCQIPIKQFYTPSSLLNKTSYAFGLENDTVLYHEPGNNLINNLLNASGESIKLDFDDEKRNGNRRDSIFSKDEEIETVSRPTIRFPKRSIKRISIIAPEVTSNPVIVDAPKNKQIALTIENDKSDLATFKYLAENFKISNTSHTLTDVCSFNGNLCQTKDLLDQYKLWNILPLIFACENDFGLKEELENFMQIYASQAQVQILSTICIILSDHFTHPSAEIWLDSYLELLSMYKMFAIKCKVMKTLQNYPRLYEMNQKSTLFHFKCYKCHKPANGVTCKECKNFVQSCSVCRKSVLGLSLFCNVCQHGGHAGHVKDWFSKNKMCPAGCGHVCMT